MWYFSWILGTAFACSFAVLNALWLELESDGEEPDKF
jgi:cyd operon protein YbgT